MASERMTKTELKYRWFQAFALTVLWLNWWNSPLVDYWAMQNGGAIPHFYDHREVYIGNQKAVITQMCAVKLSYFKSGDKNWWLGACLNVPAPPVPKGLATDALKKEDR